MKKSLLKTMLVAIGMAAGTMGAGAQKAYTLVWQNDLTTTDGWTLYGNTTGHITTNNALVAEDSYMNLMTINGKDGDNTYDFTDANFKSATDYTFEFDLAIYGSNASNHLAHLYLTGTDESEAPITIFSIDGTGYNGFELNAGSAITSQDMSGVVTSNDRNTRDNIGAAETWCHYTVVSNATDGTTLTVEQWANGEKNVLVTTTKISDGLININQINLHGGSFMQWSIDNMRLSVHSDNVLAPSASITKIDGAKRTVTITSPVEDNKIFYYLNEDSSAPTEYNAPIVLEESATIHYYAEDNNGNKSEVMEMEVNCVAVTLNAPTITRTGANTYILEATQVATDGITPNAMIHYTIGGANEQEIESGESISEVDGDIVAWTEADGFTNSDETTMKYVAAYESKDIWSYDLNSYPSTTGFTEITDAINTETGTELNDITVYNLNGIDMPNLLIENTDGWLLRNQSSNAFKSQYSESSIAINNVDDNTLIHIIARRDNGGNAISNVINGEIKYTYGDTEYFIVPSTQGAVTITFRTGISLGEITVGTITLGSVTTSITSAGWATLYSDKALDFTGTGVKAYIGTVNGSSLTLTEVTTVPAETAVIIEGEEGPYNIPVIESSETIAANVLKGTLEEITLTNDTEYYYYAMKVLSNGNVGFALVADGGTVIPAGKAYLQLRATTEAAKVQFFSLGGETTGIEAVETQAKEDGKYYNLMGVEVENPQKGIYIKNGKKVVIK